MTEELNTLEALVPKLSEKDQIFAASLIVKGRRYGCSEGQLKWVRILIERATKPAPVATEIGDLTAMVALFDKARETLKHPKIKIKAGDTTIVLSVAGERAKVPGSINVASEGRYGENTWYGRITTDGQFSASGKSLDGLIEALVAFAKEPAKIAAEYGHLVGACCFCSKALDDERSTVVGYGPVCAKRFGLPWGAKKKKAKQSDADYEAACESEEAVRHEARMY